MTKLQSIGHSQRRRGNAEMYFFGGGGVTTYNHYEKLLNMISMEASKNFWEFSKEENKQQRTDQKEKIICCVKSRI